MKDENTLLSKSISEGSAEFIAELISGETDGDYSEFKGKEIEIWNDFRNDKNKSAWDSWSSWHQANKKRPKNAGYWTGYLICKAYYKQAKNKEKAINDILSIQDHTFFYEKSNVEKYIKEKYE